MSSFQIVRQKVLTLTHEQAAQFYTTLPSDTSLTVLSQLYDAICAGPCIALEVRRENAVKFALSLCGPEDSESARVTAPRSLRALYGVDEYFNAVHVSSSSHSAAFEAQLLFNTFNTTATTTVAVLKPDLLKKNVEEQIMSKLRVEGFEIVANKKCKLSTAQVRGLYPEAEKKVIEFLTSSSVIALALKKVDSVHELRVLCGPENVKLAKKNYPTSLRALYGTDSMKNAIHCSETNIAAAKELQLLFPEFNFDLLH